MFELGTIIFAASVLTMALATFSALFDSYRDKPTMIDHYRRRLFMLFMVVWIAYILSTGEGLLMFITLFCLYGSIWWFIYDFTYNVYRANEPFKLRKDKFLDRLFIQICTTERLVKISPKGTGDRYGWKKIPHLRLSAIIQVTVKVALFVFSIIGVKILL